SGALVLTMIQCLSSQFFAGILKLPTKVAPTCNWMVSPQPALSIADLSSALVFTRTVFPGAGVSARALFTYSRGKSAGPSACPEQALCPRPTVGCKRNAKKKKKKKKGKRRKTTLHRT